MNFGAPLEVAIPGFMNVIAFSVGALMIIFALFAIEAKRLVDAVMALSALSMLAVLIFIVLKAPDVAITEASVGSGLVTAVVLFALLKVDGGSGNGAKGKGGGRE